MNPGMASMNSAEIEALAAAWFAKRQRDYWSVTDQAQLDAWLDSSTSHRISFVRIMAAWEAAGRLNALGAGVPAGTIPPRDAWGFAPSSEAPTLAAPREQVENEAEPQLDAAPAAANVTGAREFLRLPRRVRAVAALLVVGTAAATVGYLATDHTRSYVTPIGAISTVPLSDGSKITLNTDSQIHVALSSAMRRVKLDRGEAFFEVSKDAARPFVVEIADKRVIAVGTQFSVRRDNNDIRVLVTEGRVRIERRDAASEGTQTQLAAGSEARMAKTAVLIDQPTRAEVAQLLSWRTGYIVFRDTPLADAVADFNRYSARKIVIQDPALAGIRIGGNFRTDDADAFLWLLQSGFPIKVEQRTDRIILSKR
jgi:transmembrane sensor